MKSSIFVCVVLLCTVGRFSFGQPPIQRWGKAIENRAPLQPNAFDPLPLGAIEPRGWLRNQLELQAGGLTGHLGEFWNDVGDNSGWLGGTGESWERGPYYLDGLLPLAYELNDPKLIVKAKQWVDWTLSHQQADGQIGPPKNDDWWPRMVMLKVLTQYQEATGDSRVMPVMARYFAYELRELPNRPLRSWGKYRWQDNALSVLWLYNRTGDRSLLQLANLLHQQGYDWEGQFANFTYTGKETRADLNIGVKGEPHDKAMQTHGVNNAMALKVAPVWWQVSGDPQQRLAFERQLSMLDKYHGLPNGMFSGDEHFAGIDPSQGIELCAVVETMFSLEDAFDIFGDPRIADRLEKVTYNALPATLSNDMWSHQYDQQPNQISCTRAHRQWSTNNDDSNLFGLEPNFGCCTANLHQGWPKFVSSLWAATRDGGLAVAAYAPSRVRTQVRNVNLEVDEDTEYPFRDSVRFTLHPAKALPFALQLRVPGWADGGSVAVNRHQTELPKPDCAMPEGNSGAETACNTATAFHIIQRTWKDGDTVTITFRAAPRVTHWYQESAVYEIGPLVFALPLDAKWSQVKAYAQKSADWQLEPQKKWNYAVSAEPCQARVTKGPLGEVPFDVKSPGLSLHVKGRELDSWGVKDNSAAPVPLSPVSPTTTLEDLTLIPYGAAKLRITAFPFLAEKATCEENQASAGTGTF
jgi:hypothetical protein